MSLWKNGIKKTTKVDAKNLIARLKAIVKQNNIEVIHLALQSIIDELEESVE